MFKLHTCDYYELTLFWYCSAVGFGFITTLVSMHCHVHINVLPHQLMLLVCSGAIFLPFVVNLCRDGRSCKSGASQVSFWQGQTPLILNISLLLSSSSIINIWQKSGWFRWKGWIRPSFRNRSHSKHWFLWENLFHVMMFQLTAEFLRTSLSHSHPFKERKKNLNNTKVVERKTWAPFDLQD